MKIDFIIWPAILVLLLAFSDLSIAQDEDIVDFELDENLFDVEFVEAGQTSDKDTDSWFEKFTFKLSYQTITQVNKHKNANIFNGVDYEYPRTENNRFNLLVKYQNAFAPGWLLQGNGHAKLYARRDYEYRANDNNTETEYRINELFIQRSFDQHSVKFGRQTVVWGENEGNSVLDVLNTSDIRDLSIVNIEDARLNQWMLVWDYFKSSDTNNHGKLSSFVNLYPEFNPPPQRGSPFYFQPPFKLTDLDRDDALFEAGLNYSWSLPASDISIMAAYLYENQLRYEPPLGSSIEGVAVENDYALIGLSANRAIDKLLLKFDFAYSHGLIADIAPVNPASAFVPVTRIKKNKIGTSFGFEYGISSEQQVSFSVLAETFLNQDKELPVGFDLIDKDVSGSYLIRYSNTSSTGDFSASATLQSALDSSFLLASLGLNYVVNDNWSIFSQLVLTDAKEDSSAEFLDDDTRVEFTVNFSF
ncbi:DUF1302 family protein [Aurantivibrio infirmus]